MYEWFVSQRPPDRSTFAVHGLATHIAVFALAAVVATPIAVRAQLQPDLDTSDPNECVYTAG